MITTIIITVCSTLCVVGLITSIVVAHYKLGNRLKVDKFYKAYDSLTLDINRVRDQGSVELSNCYDYFDRKIAKLDDQIFQLNKHIDSRVDKLSSKMDKSVRTVSAVDYHTDVTDTNS
jgi:hypothetical protein